MFILSIFILYAGQKKFKTVGVKNIKKHVPNTYRALLLSNIKI